MTVLSSYDRLVEACASKDIEPLCSVADLSTGAMKSRVRFRCCRCHHEWVTAAANVMRPPPKGSGCPRCARASQAATLRTQGETRFNGLCEELGYDILSEYRGVHKRVLLRCRAHETDFSVAPTNLYGEQRCPVCSGNNQRLIEREVIGDLVADTTWERKGGVEPYVFVCRICKREKTLTWTHILHSRSWPLEQRLCGCRRYGEAYEKYVQAVPGYSLLEVYRGRGVPILHRHDICGEVWLCRPHNFEKKSKTHTPTRCPRCSRSGRSSSGQLQLAAFVRLLGLEIEENVPGLDPHQARREVDILTTSAAGTHVAIDFDGVWWHAEGPSRDRTSLHPRAAAQPGAALARAEALAAAGVHLVRVYSDEWAFRRPAVESRLRAILGRPTEILSARSLTLDPEADAAEVRSFLQVSHTQGAPPLQNIALALRRADGTIAAVMTFGERTLGRRAGRQLELLRFCCSPGTIIRGGAGRLLKAFLRNYSTDGTRELVTFADLRWTPVSGSRMYESIGFVLTGRTRPTYDYVHPSDSNHRVSRIALQKHKILAAHPELNPSFTEEKLAESLGYSRVWDCGNLRYALSLI